MRIKAFALTINECSKAYTLKDCSLVIDAQNFFYNCYQSSNLPYMFGTECDRYADYLKGYLKMFKEANIDCYFIFKGGTKDLHKKIMKDQNNPEKSARVYPFFVNDIVLEVLEEMGFHYVFTEYEAKADCIALAQKLQCPVISMDIEYGLSGVLYIPSVTLEFDAQKKILNCKLFLQKNLLQRFRIDRDKLATFIVLSDLNIFPEESFEDFFRLRGIPPYPTLKRNIALLKWLSRTTLKTILEHLRNTKVPKERVIEEWNKSKKMVCGDVVESLSVKCILNKELVEDGDWFELGVVLNKIDKIYIDMYRSNMILIRPNEEERESGESCKIHLNIIKYAYDLLTGFDNDGLKCIFDHLQPNYQQLLLKDSIKKPACQTNTNIFNNGWDNIRELNLFQHFMREEVNFKFDKLKEVPENAKMLLIALVYFNHKKSGNTDKITASVLMSYIMLSVVPEYANNILNNNISITASDCKLTKELLDDNFKVDSEYKNTNELHTQLLQSLNQFQECLHNLNKLNKLCGSPFQSTIYSKTFNGTFVYNIVRKMQFEDEIVFINKTLKSVPTVLNFYNHMIKLYKGIL